MKEKLLKIQMELKAPKGQFNSFGNFKYRSCEDILEAVKPLLNKNKCVLTVDDELVNIGDRYYVKATATIMDAEGEGIIVNSAYAREAEKKSGMDDSQITGTASSYARKYALNGLFLIDDTRDADTDDYVKQTGLITEKQIAMLRQMAVDQGKTLDEDQIKKWSWKQANDYITKYCKENENKHQSKGGKA